MTAAAPHVERITPADELARVVNECWPRAKFTAVQAGHKLRRLGVCGMGVLIGAVEDAFALDHSGRMPDWGVVEALARDKARHQGRRGLARQDAAQHYRGWWASWFADPAPGAMPTATARRVRLAVDAGRLAWAREILDVDAAEAGRVLLEDFRNWHEAVELWGQFWFYAIRGHDPENAACPLNVAAKEHAAAQAADRQGVAGADAAQNAAVAAVATETCSCRPSFKDPARGPQRLTVLHQRLRNLREFGPQTRAARKAALERLELFAVERHVRLDGCETVAEQEELPW